MCRALPFTGDLPRKAAGLRRYSPVCQGGREGATPGSSLLGAGVGGDGVPERPVRYYAVQRVSSAMSFFLIKAIF